MRKIAKFVFSRMVIGGLLVVLQLVWFLKFLLHVGQYHEVLGTIMTAYSMIVVIYIINKEDNPAYKLAWVIPILAFPIFGGVLYLYLGNKKPSKRLRRILDHEFRETSFLLMQKKSVQDALFRKDPVAGGQSHYISDYAGYPIYKNTKTIYFSSGEACYERVLEELKKAEHYIFMEYFIVKDGQMLEEIVEILTEKASQGVDVRFMYDDMGCISSLDPSFGARMKKRNIETLCFNPFVPFISTAWNNRDHRKIMIIDGHTAFTGGFNLADEYINREERFGYWKDSGLMLQGEAVWSFTVMFLQVWNPLKKQKEDYLKFRPHRHIELPMNQKGWVQPYSDTPLDKEIVGENVYLNLVNGASRYLYLTTPYLIIDNELMTALCLAAKRGVDVRILMPGIPDKKMVFLVSQSYYQKLAEAGVKIYEYTPGFVHAKNVVCDDKIATVGTINWDYRSLYLHFECGVFLYESDTVADIYNDFIETLKESRRITREMCKKPIPMRLLQSILRVFSPLL